MKKFRALHENKLKNTKLKAPLHVTVLCICLKQSPSQEVTKHYYIQTTEDSKASPTISPYDTCRSHYEVH